MTTNLTQRIMYGAKVGLVGLALMAATAGCGRQAETTEFNQNIFKARPISVSGQMGHGYAEFSAYLDIEGTKVIAHRYRSMGFDCNELTEAVVLTEAAIKAGTNEFIEVKGTAKGNYLEIDSLRYGNHEVNF